MTGKRKNAVEFLTPQRSKEGPKVQVKQNAYPAVLKGGRLKQLDLPVQFLAVEKGTLSGRSIKASDLAHVRASLKAKKLG